MAAAKAVAAPTEASPGCSNERQGNNEEEGKRSSTKNGGAGGPIDDRGHSGEGEGEGDDGGDIGSGSGASDDDEGSKYHDTDDSDVEYFFRARARLEAIFERPAAGEGEGGSISDSSSSSSSEDGPSTEFAARVHMVSAATGSECYEAREVKGTHRTGCNDCGTRPSYGSYYAVDQSDGGFNPPKLCERCVGRRSDLLYEISRDSRRYQRIQRMRRELDEKGKHVNPFTPGGLFEAGPDVPFRLSLISGEPKTFKEYMET